MLKKIVAAGITLVNILITTSSALACACCVNRGHYERGRVKADQFYSSLLSDIKLARSADLYLTEAGFEGIKGLPELVRDEAAGRETKFEITSSIAMRKWRISVDAGMGHKGTLVLPMPAMMTKHAVDIDGVDKGNGVVLYKEFSLTSRLTTATGIFKSAKAANFELIFQGRGNGCDDTSDFNRWFLIIEGPRASYVIFGKAV